VNGVYAGGQEDTMTSSDLTLEMDRSRPPYVVVAPQGELDIATSQLFRQHLAGLAEPAPPQVVLDLSGVTFMDSAYLGEIIRGMKHFRGLGGDLSLAAGPPQILKLLDITGLATIFRVWATIDEATTSH
jgi:anti-sigma B factor antagonist